MKQLTENDKARLDLRFGYHPPVKNAVKYAHEYWREACRQLAENALQLLGENREASLVLSKIEEAMMWGNAAIARHQLPLYGEEDPRAGQTSLLEPASDDVEATGIQKLVG